MRRVRTLIPVALIVSLLMGITSQVAMAAPPATVHRGPGPGGLPLDNTYHIQCQQGTCTVEAGLEELSPLARFGAEAALVLLQDQLSFLPEGSSLVLESTEQDPGQDSAVSQSLVLRLPVGDIPLRNADLIIELDQEAQLDRLHGTAEVPFPTFGVLEDVQILKPAMAEVGFDQGAALAHLGPSLKPDRQYLYFRFGTGLDLIGDRGDTADGSQPSARFRLTVPSGQNATLIVDPEESFVYLAGNLTFSQNGIMANLSDQLQLPFGVGNDLLDTTTSSEFSLDVGDLPLERTVSLHASGAYSPDQEDSAASQRFLKLGAGYEVDDGIIGRALGVDAKPISVQGVVTLSPKGALIEGVATSSVEPETAFDGAARVEAYVPFEDGAQEAYVQLDGETLVPAAGVKAEIAAGWHAGEKPTVQASLTTQSPTLAAASTGNPTADEALAEAAPGDDTTADVMHTPDTVEPSSSQLLAPDSNSIANTSNRIRLPSVFSDVSLDQTTLDQVARWLRNTLQGGQAAIGNLVATVAR